MTDNKHPHELYQRNDLTDEEALEALDIVERTVRFLRDELNRSQKRGRTPAPFGVMQTHRKAVERITHLVTSVRNTSRERKKDHDKADSSGQTWQE